MNFALLVANLPDVCHVPPALPVPMTAFSTIATSAIKEMLARVLTRLRFNHAN